MHTSAAIARIYHAISVSCSSSPQVVSRVVPVVPVALLACQSVEEHQLVSAGVGAVDRDVQQVDRGPPEAHHGREQVVAPAVSSFRRTYPKNTSGKATCVSDPPRIIIVEPRNWIPKGMNSICPNSWMARSMSLRSGTMPYSSRNALCGSCNERTPLGYA